jgi:hypothetical protein
LWSLFAAAAVAGISNRQTKFGRPDVNDAGEMDRCPQGDGSWLAVGANIRRQIRSPSQRVEDNAFHLVQWLSWRGFAVCQNFSNDRRKLINAGAGHDDAVPAPMSFLSDTQEFTSVVLPELDVEVLALNLQFFRLDDVVHFALRPPSLGSETLKWKKN